ncbi:MAG: hypothetical protein ACIAQZ_13635 [Sedimentisphaeraceae bacterium JB056]
MMLLIRFIFAAACVTTFLIFTVYIRTENPRIFYQCRHSKVQKDRIEQDLRLMKIEIESFKNPVDIKDVIEKADESTTEEN